MVSETGSAKAETASENATECLFRLAAALTGSHSKLIIPAAGSAIKLPGANLTNDQFLRAKAREMPCAQSCAPIDNLSTTETARFIVFFARRGGSEQH